MLPQFICTRLSSQEIGTKDCIINAVNINPLLDVALIVKTLRGNEMSVYNIIVSVSKVD